MAFFNVEVPLISRKPSIAELPDSFKVWRVRWQMGQAVLWSSFYTKHDQACLVWGVLTAVIFAIAQFLPLSWTTQAVMASLLTGLGSIGMAWLTWHYTHLDDLAVILYAWLILMVTGTVLTDLSLWLGWSAVLMGLCPLWLGICGIGYLITGLGMRSRTILLCSGIHFLAIGLLSYAQAWQVLITGLVISSCVLALAELQWDANGVCGATLDRSFASLD